jgi:hypothetical protein
VWWADKPSEAKSSANESASIKFSGLIEEHFSTSTAPSADVFLAQKTITVQTTEPDRCHGNKKIVRLPSPTLANGRSVVSFLRQIAPEVCAYHVKKGPEESHKAISQQILAIICILKRIRSRPPIPFAQTVKIQGKTKARFAHPAQAGP